MIETVFSTEPKPAWPGHLQTLAAMPRREPFDAAAMGLVERLSGQILRSDVARRFPELAALAHWFRPASLRDMKKRLRTSDADTKLLPRGVVFELAPSNVDILFIYGWLLSFLTGNATIVRVSKKPSDVRDVFLALVADVAKEPALRDALRDSWIVTYDHDARITRTISEVCDARLVWGGDATVEEIRSIFLKPLAVEIAFADRFSFAAFDARTMLDASDKTLAEMARRFANDTLWFGQQACSSPRAVFWVGDKDNAETARKRFWPLYSKAAKNFEDEPAAVMSRVADLFVLAGSGAIDSLGAPLAQLPGSGIGTKNVPEIREIHSGFGLFVEYIVAGASDIAQFLADKDQTLVVYGLNENDLEALVAALPNRSLDRIVELGQATDFDVVWDGTNLFDVLTRKLSVPNLRRKAG